MITVMSSLDNALTVTHDIMQTMIENKGLEQAMIGIQHMSMLPHILKLAKRYGLIVSFQKLY